MKPNEVERAHRSTKLLVVGFACTLLLAVLTAGFTVRQAILVSRSAAAFVTDVNDVTRDLGDVGEQLARLRARVARGLHAPREFEQDVPVFSRIETRFRSLIERLDSHAATFDPDTRQAWLTHEAEIRRLGRIYTDAASSIRAGRTERASELMAGEAAAAARVHDGLDELQAQFQRSTQARLDRLRGRVSTVVTTGLAAVGALLFGMVLIWSVTARALRRRTREAADYTRRLEDANADLDAFAGRVAHDLRNALGPVVMGPPILRSSSQSPEIHRLADRMERSANKAVSLVNALLAFSRASQTAESRESEALRSAVKSVLEELAPEIARVDATIDVGELPDVNVRCSPELLHIVLANLCSNAVKFLEGRIERTVRLSARMEDGQCRIDVEDTGPGIPRHALEKIFEPFYRVPGTHARGTGIGLATVQRIVEQHAGRIAVESTEGRGSRFQVWLPLAPADRVAPLQPESRPPVAAHHH